MVAPATMMAQTAGNVNKKDKEKSGLSKVLDKSREEQMKTFEKIFLAQVKHQDPLNPTSTDDLTRNVMMFHSSAQQARTNELLEQININHIKAQGLAAKSYLNKEVEYQGNEFSYEAGEEIMSVLMPDNIEEAQLMIMDPTGGKVTAMPIPASPGLKTIQWDGSIDGRSDIKAPEGQYKAIVVGFTKDEQTIEVPLSFKGIVRRIGYDDSSSEFALLVKNTPIEMSDITSVSKPAASEIVNMTKGVQEQIKRYDELFGYVKDKIDSTKEAHQS